MTLFYLCVVVLVVGVGSQFLAIATGVLVMALMGMFNVHRHGSINIAVIVLYALTSCTFLAAFCVFSIFSLVLLIQLCTVMGGIASRKLFHPFLHISA